MPEQFPTNTVIDKSKPQSKSVQLDNQEDFITVGADGSVGEDACSGKHSEVALHQVWLSQR